ncbi:MAG: asparagine synthase-related protein [Nitrososphaerota archaeon]
MAIILAALSRHETGFSAFVDDVLRLSHRWPTTETYADNTRVSLSELAGTRGQICLVVNHAGSSVVVEQGEELVVFLSPSRLLGREEIEESPFASIIHVSRDRVLIRQGPTGSPPLAYKLSKDCVVVSSLPRLVNNEFGEATYSPPKSDVRLTPGAVEVSHKGAQNQELPTEHQALDSEAQLLLEALTDSIKKSVAKRPSILFSGGLDSSLLLWLCMDMGLRPLALSVGMKGSHDLTTSKRAASVIGADYLPIELTEESLRTSISHLMKNLELPSKMDKALAVLVYEGSKCSAENGRRQLISGQGADELFGGYIKYLRLVDRGEAIKAESEMRRDAESLWYRSIPRDYGSACLAGCLMTTPYLDERIVKNAYKMPLQFKVSRGVRKVVLRMVAKLAGLHEDVAMIEKKAAQYGTGIERALKRLSV